MDPLLLLHTPPQVRARAEIAQFIVDMYGYYLASSQRNEGLEALPTQPAVPHGISEDMAEDCYSIAEVLAAAIRNVYPVAWDAVRYADEVGGGTEINIEAENDLLKKFPPLCSLEDIIAGDRVLPIVRGPAVIADRHGNILVWSLPDILPRRRQDAFMAATRHLEKKLRTKRNAENPNPGQAWRFAERFFTAGKAWKSGTIYFSPAWFKRGQNMYAPDARPVASETIKSEEGALWMNSLHLLGGLLDGILAVIHPAQYRAGFESQRRMSMRASELRRYISQWPFCYNAAQVMVNRMSIHHRDTSGRPGWFDLLLTLGTYGDKGIMSFRNLGASVPYPPGSVVMVNSRIVIHGVPEVPPDRICYAFFMSNKAHNWLGVEDPGWSKVGDRRRGVYTI